MMETFFRLIWKERIWGKLLPKKCKERIIFVNKQFTVFISDFFGFLSNIPLCSC